LHRAKTGVVQQEFTTQLTHHNLAPLQVAVSLFAVVDESGATIALRFLLRDVSATRADLVASRAPAAIVRAALDALSAHVAVLDADGRIVTVNRAWMDAERPAGIFALGAGTGDNYLALCDAAVAQHGEAAGVAREAVETVLNGHRRRADVLLTLEPATAQESGDQLPEWYALRATRCDGPEPVHVVVTHEDTTAEQKALARERSLAKERAARTAAEAASQSKSEFLATLSNELRTPLNAIAGYAQLLERGVRGPVTAQQAEDLRRILRSERHLLGLINELLNFSRLERGDVPLDISTFLLIDAVHEVLELIEPQAAARRLMLTVHCDADDLLVSADREKLRQILINLLSNSLKFTREGGAIRIECDRNDVDVMVRVLDTGIGIPATRLSDIFDPFVQVHRGSGGSSDGIGLGLAISRNLARAMGGDLTATSTLGTGSSFELRLARAMASAE
jgi:signal transduction histidine kinase